MWWFYRSRVTFRFCVLVLFCNDQIFFLYLYKILNLTKPISCGWMENDLFKYKCSEEIVLHDQANFLRKCLFLYVQTPVRFESDGSIITFSRSHSYTKRSTFVLDLVLIASFNDFSQKTSFITIWLVDFF